MDAPDQNELNILKSLLSTSLIEEDRHEQIISDIDKIDTYEEYQAAMYALEARQPSIHEIPNPKQADITKHIKLLTYESSKTT